MPSFHSRQQLATCKRSLHKYSSVVQEYGMFFGGFAWDIYCTGTFKKRQSLESATNRFYGFLNRLEEALGEDVITACIAVPERTTSGLGRPSGPWHWHFLMAAPPLYRKDLLGLVESIWNKENGWMHARRYRRIHDAAFYLAKTAEAVDFDFVERHLERMTYTGPSDIHAAKQKLSYIPKHVRHTIKSNTLVLRFGEQSPETHGFAYSLEIPGAVRRPDKSRQKSRTDSGIHAEAKDRHCSPVPRRLARVKAAETAPPSKPSPRKAIAAKPRKLRTLSEAELAKELQKQPNESSRFADSLEIPRPVRKPSKLRQKSSTKAGTETKTEEPKSSTALKRTKKALAEEAGPEVRTSHRKALPAKQRNRKTSEAEDPAALRVGQQNETARFADSLEISRPEPQPTRQCKPKRKSTTPRTGSTQRVRSAVSTRTERAKPKKPEMPRRSAPAFTRSPPVVIPLQAQNSSSADHSP